MEANRSVVEEMTRNLTMVVLPVTAFIGFEAFVGFFGNILILVIYAKRYERSNFRYFVLSMAVIDFTSCVTTLPGEIFSQTNWYTYEHGWICKVKSYFNVLTVWGSACILLLLAFDRYRKICKPLAWQIQPSFALKLCVCSVILSSLVASPIAILWGKQTYIYEYEGLNLTVSICEKSSVYADDIYPLLYIGCVYILPVGIILIVVCSLNIFTARELFGNKSLRIRTVKCGLSSAFSSESTLSTFISEPDLEKLGVEMPKANDSRSTSTGMNGTGKGGKKGQDKGDGIADAKSNNKDKSVAKAHGGFQTRVSFITTQNPSVVSTTDIVFDNDPKPDFCLDIGINSSFVKNSGNRETALAESTSSKTAKDKNRTNGHTVRVAGKAGDAKTTEFRRKQKTIIMLVLTSVFVFTMLLYVILISFVAGTEGILRTLTNSEKVVFFFFWRLYFINTIVNPLLYGFLDPRFRAGLNQLFKRKSRSRGIH